MAARQHRPVAQQRLALMLVDVLNPFDFDGADALFPSALAAARAIASLQARARLLGIPSIYLNDNFGYWHLGFRELVEMFRGEDQRGRRIIDLLDPDPARDHFVLKPMHSGFFQTGLEVLLRRLAAETLVITGIAGDICVFFTANDAYMRDFRVVVPTDCVASERPEDNAHALRQMARILKADVRPAGEIDFARLGASTV